MSKEGRASLGEVIKHADRWLTVGKIAERLSVHPDTIRRWASKGQIKSLRHPVNNYRLFLLDDLGNGADFKDEP